MGNITSQLTGVEMRIISFLLSNMGEQFAVREIARKAKMDYKLAYTAVQKLAKKEILLKKRQANADLCSLNLRGDLTPVNYVEMLRTREFLQKHRELHTFFTCIREKTKEIFYTLLVFGSYAKGTARSSSDVDVVIIAPTRSIGEEIERVVGMETTFIHLKVQTIVLDEHEFVSALSEKELNVATEAFRDHIIIAGVEAFYNGVRQVS